MSFTSVITRAAVIAALLFTGVFDVGSDYASASGSTNLRIEILPLCGNDIKETGERCDGADLGNESCVSQGYTSGSLVCDQSCGVFDYAACVDDGGHGVGYGASPLTSVSIAGRASPGGLVTVLKDGQVAAKVVADSEARFSAVMSGLNGGRYIFGVYVEDLTGLRSPILNIPTSVSFGGVTQVSGVLLAPTITGDKEKVGLGGSVRISGRSAPKSEVKITVSSGQERSIKVFADDSGEYAHALTASDLGIGQHEVKAVASYASFISPASQTHKLTVATDAVDEPEPEPEVPIINKTDLNDDGRVDLVDFSIVLYWYEKPFDDEFKAFEAEYLNGDGKLDLVDFSILAFHWTG